MVKKTAEEAHRDAVRIQLKEERIVLGPYASHSLRTDAKHLCFVLSRYKFCAKLLEGKQKVLEIGCGDAVGLPIVAQAVGRVYATDWDAAVAGPVREGDRVASRRLDQTRTSGGSAGAPTGQSRTASAFTISP